MDSKRLTSGVVKSIRNSAAFLDGNKFGEGRRVDEDGDEGDPRMSHKAR